MSRKVSRQIDEFTCHGDDGQTYTVIEYQDFIDASSRDGEEWLPGLKWLELPNGRKLNFISDDTFQVVSTGVIVRKR